MNFRSIEYCDVHEVESYVESFESDKLCLLEVLASFQTRYAPQQRRW